MTLPYTRQQKISRAVNLYVVLVIAVAFMAWVLSTNPPAPIVLFGILMIFPPLLGIARHEGHMDGLRWAADRVEREKERQS